MNDPGSSLTLTFHAALPSSSSISEFWPESQQFVALPHDLQRAVTSQLAALHIGFSILLALARTTFLKLRTAPASFEHYQPWILDSTVLMWQYFRRWTTGPDKHPLHDEIVALYLQLLELIAAPTTVPETHFLSSTKAVQSLVCSLSILLGNISTALSSESNQIRAASCFTRLHKGLTASRTCTSVPRRRQESTRLAVLKELEANIAKICQHAEQFSHLHRDLQVCIETRHFHARS